MQTTKRTTEEKRVYFRKLRDNWLNAKKQLADGQIDAIQAIIKNHGLNISATGFFFVSLQMRHQQLDGLPYLDAKTYQGWKENGFQVRKGEKSTLSGITWISPTQEKDEETGVDIKNDDYVFPKEYHLFHRSQVEPILEGGAA